MALTGDDRATILGALLSLSDQLVDRGRETALAGWRHRGRRAFEAHAEAAASLRAPED